MKKKNDGVKRVIKINIDKNDKLYNVCEKYSILAKNLYNFTNYKIRQIYLTSKKLKDGLEVNNDIMNKYSNVLGEINQFNETTEKNKILFQNKWYGDYIGGNDVKTPLQTMLKDSLDFIQMPASTSQQIVGQVVSAWQGYFESLNGYYKDKSKYKGLPKPPNYKKDKSVFIISSQSVIIIDKKLSFTNGKKGYRSYKEFNCGQEITVPLPNWKRGHYDDAKLCFIRVVPKNNKFTLEFVYNIDIVPKKEIKNRIIAIDIGVDRLATVVNNIDEKPFAINGKPLKSTNKYWNKKVSKHKSELIRVNKRFSSKNYLKMCDKRNSIMETYMHQSASYIINWCSKYDIDTIVIGKNKGWKQKTNIGNETQTFIQIPFTKFINKIEYRAEELGIKVVLQEESYTSKASFIDNDNIPTYGVNDEYGVFSGKRIKRGLYKSKDNIEIHADLNGAYNIMRKYDNKFKYNEKCYLHPYIIKRPNISVV